MMKPFLTLSLLAAAGLSAQAQTVLIADTAMTTGANASGAISAIATGGTLFGNNINETAFFRLAEDFTIPAGETWRVDSLITYTYQTGSTTTSTITAGHVRMYNGTPGAGGTLMVGDTTTNRLGSSSFTGIYRVNSSTSTDVTRPIMRVALSVPATTPAQLAAGTYWISWSLKGSLASGPWSPVKVNPAGALPTGQNGRQNDTGVWAAALDGTTPAGYNFMLKGARTTSVEDAGSAKAFSLRAPFPNPLNQGGTTTLSFSLASKSRVSLSVVNAAGQRVATVVDNEMTAGEYMLPFSTAGLASGLYRVTLQTESGSTAVPLTVK